VPAPAVVKSCDPYGYARAALLLFLVRACREEIGTEGFKASDLLARCLHGLVSDLGKRKGRLHY
jgi:hypothetical protein